MGEHAEARIGDVVLVVDRGGAVVGCTPAASDWLGTSVGEIVGKPVTTWFAACDAPIVDRLARSGWLGAGERGFRLGCGRRVLLDASADGRDRVRVRLRDHTLHGTLSEIEDARRRMVAVSELAGSIARELADPVSIVQGRLELLLDGGVHDPHALEKHLRVALEHASRISATLRNMRLVGQAPMASLDPVDLGDAIDAAIELVTPRLRAEAVDVSVPDAMAVGGELALCARAIANLLIVAADAAGRDGRVSIAVRDQREAVRVHISAGPEPPEIVEGGDDLDGRSCCFGLSVARTVIVALGAELRARRAAGGVAMEVSFQPAPEKPARSRPAEQRLIVVGEGLGRTLQALVGHDGYAVHCVHSAEEALAALDGSLPVAGVVSGLLLDGMSGLGLAREALARRRDLEGRVLLVTDAALSPAPADAVVLRPPLARSTVLEALGRKLRRKKVK
jgi:CheY-like chemotaxis protein